MKSLSTPVGHRTNRLRLVGAWTGLALGTVGMLSSGGCQADEPVGHSKTTTKRTIDTPTEKTTVTETHEKNTTLYPR